MAHHSRDQAETILLNLFRGSGLGGLKGIPYVRENIIRPLLDAEKEEILAYLEEKEISWVNVPAMIRIIMQETASAVISFRLLKKR